MNENPKEKVARKTNTEQVSNTYHNCKIINIVTPSKKVPPEIIDLLSDSSSEIPDVLPKKTNTGSDDSEAQFEKALMEVDVDEIAANYWSRKTTTTVTNVNIKAPEKRSGVKNPYLKK